MKTRRAILLPALALAPALLDTSAIGLDAATPRFEFDVSKMIAGGEVIC